jgi:hypothetical protein
MQLFPDGATLPLLLEVGLGAPSARRASPSAACRSRRRTTGGWRRTGRRHRARGEREVESACAPGNWLSLKQAQALPNAPDITTPRAARPRHPRRAARLCATPVRGGAAHRWARFRRIHAGGDGRRWAREYAGAVGMVPATPSAHRPSASWRSRRGTTRRLAPELAAGIAREKSAKIAVLLGCVLCAGPRWRRSPMGARRAHSLEATVAARHANAPASSPPSHGGWVGDRDASATSGTVRYADDSNIYVRSERGNG